jgi:hypothetical protein
MPDGPRYEDDFYAWTRHQAEVLRTMPVSDNRFDREHLAEEIEDLGKSERDAVRSQIRRVIEHLLKLAYSRAERPRFDWMHSVSYQTLARHWRINSRPLCAAMSKRGWKGCMSKRAEMPRSSLRNFGEHGAAQAFPDKCPYSLDEICQEDWYPISPGHEPQTEVR